MNIFDYLKWRGDIPFYVCPFNDVDNLILAELAYTDFGGLVPENGPAVPLKTVCEAFFAAHTREELLAATSYTAPAPLLMEEMVRGARFGETRAAFYRNERDPEKDLQFSAVTFLLPDGTAYIAFRGTDGTLVGWKEDFNLSFLSGTEGQQRAAEYLNRAGKALTCSLRAGGHSKGGNLAVYAASRCEADIQDRILAVYSNDGPGFRPEFLAEPGYQRVLPKVVSIIPDTSVIGVMMESCTEPRVIRSSASGMVQHDGFTWETERDRFAEAKLSDTSRLVCKMLAEWMSRTNDADRKSLTDTIFSLLASTGEETFSGINGSKRKSVEAIASSALNLPMSTLSDLLKMVGRIGQSGVKTASSYIQNLATEKLQALGGKNEEEKKPE